jgi:sugar (pentulose or hexulose) kinase
MYIDALAASSVAGAHGLLFTPWLNGERAPFRDANARACYIGLSAHTTTADLHRAVLGSGFRV